MTRTARTLCIRDDYGVTTRALVLQSERLARPDFVICAFFDGKAILAKAFVKGSPYPVVGAYIVRSGVLNWNKGQPCKTPDEHIRVELRQGTFVPAFECLPTGLTVRIVEFMSW